MGKAVGMAAMRSGPDSPRLSASMSCRMARLSATMRRAHSSVRSPSGVKPMKREPRCTSSTPSVSSSCLMPAESVGCVTPQASAARPKCRSRARAMRYSSLSIIRPLGTLPQSIPRREFHRPQARPSVGAVRRAFGAVRHERHRRRIPFARPDRPRGLLPPNSKVFNRSCGQSVPHGELEAVNRSGECLRVSMGTKR